MDDLFQAEAVGMLSLPGPKQEIGMTSNEMDLGELYERLRREVFIQQDPQELVWLMGLVSALNPSTIIEIGVLNGGTLKIWEQLVQPGGLVIGIDKENQIRWDIKKSDRRVVFVNADSTNPATVREVGRILDGREADFLFIDGDHSLEGCRFDFENYSRFVRGGGLLALHDLQVGTRHPGTVFESLPGRKTQKLIGQGTGVWWKPSTNLE